jgi:hypothetical protein
MTVGATVALVAAQVEALTCVAPNTALIAATNIATRDAVSDVLRDVIGGQNHWPIMTVSFDALSKCWSRTQPPPYTLRGGRAAKP